LAFSPVGYSFEIFDGELLNEKNRIDRLFVGRGGAARGMSQEGHHDPAVNGG
jgi:hypothetical protein